MNILNIRNLFRLAVLAASLAGAAKAEPLTFAAALSRAVREAPTLAASAARIDAGRQAAIPADALPDPQLTLGLENVPIEGSNRFSLDSEAMTMRRIGVMQAFPNRAKRAARAAAAQADIGQAEAEAAQTRLSVRRDTALAWIRRHTAEAQLQHIAALVEENHLLQAAVRARLAGGKAAAAETVAPREEAALIAEREEALRASRDQAIAALQRWVGAAAAWPLAGEPPAWPIERETLLGQVRRHPDLVLLDAKARALDAGIGEAQAATRPDWSLGFAYQVRGAQFGDMASIELGFDLPLFAAKRQTPRIEARRHERAALDADYQSALRALTAELDSDLAEYRRLQQALTRQRDVLLPLAEERVALTLAAWRGGQGNLAELIAARRARIDAELRAVELAGARGEMAARLHFTYAGEPS